MQKGESDEFSKAMDTLTTDFGDGQFEQLILFNSKSMYFDINRELLGYCLSLSYWALYTLF